MQNGEEKFGSELVDGSKGVLKKGSVYVTLARMEEKGLIQSREIPSNDPRIGLPRRTYRVGIPKATIE